MEVLERKGRGMFPQYTQDVLRCAADFALSHAETPQQYQLLQTALQDLHSQVHSQAQSTGWAPFIHLPLFVYAALRGDEQAATPLASATSLLYLGINLFDELADNELAPHWQRYPPAQINLAAATLLCALPQLVLSTLAAPPAVLASLQRTLARGLLVMSAGQQQDLAATGGDFVPSGEVEASVKRKSGEELAMFASLAAELAEAPADIVASYASVGRAMGTAGQLSSDCYDLFQADLSSDLANGTRTLPIALYLERLREEERAPFLTLLRQAGTEEDAREAVRQRLRTAGVLRKCAFIVEVYCQRALQILNEVQPLEPAASWLRTCIRSISFFPKEESHEPTSR